MYVSKYQTQTFFFTEISFSFPIHHLLLAVLYDPSLASIQIQQDKSDVAGSFPFQCSALHVRALMLPANSDSVSQK